MGKPLAFFLLPLSQSDPCSATVLVDELYVGRFQRPPNDVKRRATRLSSATFQLPHCNYPNACPIREILLVPIEETSRRAALCWSDHGDL